MPRITFGFDMTPDAAEMLVAHLTVAASELAETGDPRLADVLATLNGLRDAFAQPFRAPERAEEEAEDCPGCPECDSAGLPGEPYDGPEFDERLMKGFAHAGRLN